MESFPDFFPTGRQADVLVYGGTAGGVCAAVAASEAGADTVLVTTGRHLGGMTSGGLGYTDVGDVRVVGGLAARFRRDVADHYGVAPGRFAGPEPHVAEQIFTRWLETAGVEVVFEQSVVRLHRNRAVIESVELTDGDRIGAAVVIDASYEGDLLAAAGVPYAVGREDRDRYRERFAGRREVVPGRHSFPAWVSPFRDDDSGREEGPLLDQLCRTPMVDVGRGDAAVMSYGFRVCLSSGPDRIAFPRPSGYQEDYWELGRRLFDHWSRNRVEVSAGDLIGLEPNLPASKCDGNSIGPFSLSVLDGSAWDYPDASAARRRQIWNGHRDHTAGLLYFLSTDPAVPAHVRGELSRWGLAPDEFADTGHLPHQLYVREARRMISDVVLTEHDLLAGRIPEDTVALGSYHLDIREVQRNWTWVYEHPLPVGMVVTEGYLSVPVPVYGIPFRALLPPEEVCTNLLVSTCVSASQVAFSSIRMEMQYQMLGHAAGLAAAQAVRSGSDLHRLDPHRLRSQLHHDGQVLSL